MKSSVTSCKKLLLRNLKRILNAFELGLAKYYDPSPTIIDIKLGSSGFCGSRQQLALTTRLRIVPKSSIFLAFCDFMISPFLEVDIDLNLRRGPTVIPLLIKA